LADYEFPSNCRYTAEDEWVRADGDRVTIGVTDYAQQQLGDVVFVELPEVGSAITQGQSFGVIESVKAVSDLYAPLSGEVVEVNEELEDSPEKINEDCYGAGWILVLAPSDSTQIDKLMDADGYRSSVADRDT